jgi:tryptophan synthase alpha chain
MTLQRLEACLRRLDEEGRGGLSVYVPFGYPRPDATAALLDAAVAGGADWIELGLPFSDPAADGPVLQAASAAALRAGATVQGALDGAARFRERHPDVPVVAMTYANLLHRLGWDASAARLAAAGIDGAIVPDVPLEESGPLLRALHAHGLAHVPLVTPATPDARMAQVAATADGFLYVVANVGVTGQADPGPLMRATVERARRARPGLPVAVGFGVRGPDDVARVLAAGAQAAIVGSQLVPALAAGPEALRAEVARLRPGAAGAARATSLGAARVGHGRRDGDGRGDGGH